MFQAKNDAKYRNGWPGWLGSDFRFRSHGFRRAADGSRGGRRANASPYTIGIAAAALASMLTYWLDPVSGRRRRALARDGALHRLRQAREALSATGRDVRHRIHGVAAEARHWVWREHVDDLVLEERVRSRLGRVCSHPGAVEVSCRNGKTVLEGPILSREAHHALRQIARVPGVRGVQNRLEPHDQPGGIPGLQGGTPLRRQRRFAFFQKNWSPSTRLVAMAGGLALMGCGARSRRGSDVFPGLAGLLLFTRGTTNLELRRLFGIGAGRRAIDLQKEIRVDAPLAEVFAFWSAPENFPRFMSHVREVEQVGPALYRWKVDGPGAIPVEWEAEVAALVPNEVLAWRTVPSSIVRHAGVVRFEPHESGGTRVRVRMHYNPPAGAIGHAIAKLFGADPKRQMEDDLLRFKSLLEYGKATGRKETVTRDELRVRVPVETP